MKALLAKLSFDRHLDDLRWKTHVSVASVTFPNVEGDPVSTEHDDADEPGDDTLYDANPTAGTGSDAGGKWASGLTALLGLWLLVVPTFVWEAVGADFWNDVVVGALVAVTAGYAAFAGGESDFGVGPSSTPEPFGRDATSSLRRRFSRSES